MVKPGKPSQALTVADKRSLDTRVLLTKDIEEHIVKNVAAGMFEKQASQFAGIDHAVYRQWKKWAHEGVEPYAGFFRKVLAAQQARVTWALAQIQMGAKEWKSAAWWLDRVYPEWREDNRTDEPPQAPPMETIIREVSARFTPEEVRQIAASLLGSDPLIDQLPAHGEETGQRCRQEVNVRVARPNREP